MQGREGSTGQSSLSREQQRSVDVCETELGLGLELLTPFRRLWKFKVLLNFILTAVGTWVGGDATLPV